MICFRLCDRKVSSLWSDVAIDYPRSRQVRLEIFYVNTLNRIGPPRKHCQFFFCHLLECDFLQFQHELQTYFTENHASS